MLEYPGSSKCGLQAIVVVVLVPHREEMLVAFVLHTDKNKGRLIESLHLAMVILAF